MSSRGLYFTRFSGLLHCQVLGFTPFFACVCCSAAIITAYLMRTEHLSQEGVYKSIICLNFCRFTNWYMPVASSFVSSTSNGHFVWWNWKYYRCFSNLNIIPNFFLLSIFFFCWHIPADALESLRHSCEFVCPNDGFLDQVMD